MGPFRDSETKKHNENNSVKNPNWRESDQLAIYKDDSFVKSYIKVKSGQGIIWSLAYQRGVGSTVTQEPYSRSPSKL